MIAPVQNNSLINFTFPLGNFVDLNGVAVPPSTFSDAGTPVLYLIDSAGKLLGPFPATLDTGIEANFEADVAVYDPYFGNFSPANPKGWVQGGTGWLPKTWWFQFQAPKGTTGTFYSSPLAPFQVNVNISDLGGIVSYVAPNQPLPRVITTGTFLFPFEQMADIPQIVRRGAGIHIPPAIWPRQPIQPTQIREQFVDDVPSIVSHKPGTNIPPSVGPRPTLQPIPIREETWDTQVILIRNPGIGVNLPLRPVVMVMWPIFLEYIADNPQTIIGGHIGTNVPSPIVLPKVIQVLPDFLFVDNPAVQMRATGGWHSLRSVIISPALAAFEDLPISIARRPAGLPRPGQMVRMSSPLEAFADDRQFIIQGAPTNMLPVVGPRPTLQPTLIVEQFADFIPFVASGTRGVNIPTFAKPPVIVAPTPIIEQWADFTPTIASHKPATNVPAVVAPRVVIAPNPILEQFVDFTPLVGKGAFFYSPPRSFQVTVQPSPIRELLEDMTPVMIGGHIGVNVPGAMAPHLMVQPTPILEQFADFTPLLLWVQPAGTQIINTVLPPPDFVTPVNNPAPLAWMDPYTIFTGTG